MKDIIAEAAGKDDLEAMADLLQELFTIEEDFDFDRQAAVKGLSMILENPSAYISVARDSEKVIGICSIQTLISTAEGGPVGLIEDMVVTKAYRRQGVGKLIMNDIYRWAKDKQLTRLQLLADKNNTPALDYYQQMNWESTQLICLRNKKFNK
jgi:GNAT superfamily N-acetyltransferase